MQRIKSKKLGSLALLACLVIAMFSACHPTSNDEKTGKKVFTLKVNEHVFTIPIGYVWAYDRGENGTVIGANLHALYPGFEPQTRQNKEEFDKGGWADGRLISFLVDDFRAIKPISKIIERYLGEAEEIGPYRKEGEFYIYPVMDKKRELLLSTLNGENNIYLYCMKDNAVPHPSCDTNFALNRDIYIHLTFSKKLLPHWKGLTNELKTLVNSFQAKNEQ